LASDEKNYKAHIERFGLMRITGLGWMGVIAEDFATAVAFFGEKLGLSLAFRDEAKAVAHFRMQSGQLIEVYGPSNRQRKEKYRLFNGPVLGFAVQDIELAHQEMIAKGANFITGIERWEGEAWAMFLGPEDKLFALQQSGNRRVQNSAKFASFSWAGVVMQDFDGAINYFSELMQMPLAWRNDKTGLAHFMFSNGHHFEIIDAGNSWSRIMPFIAIGFEAEDVWQARAELESLGVGFIGKVVVTSVGAAFTYFHGPDGYPYEIWKPGEADAE
jgi:predicted enzyme related to lactoylglutathione lyase